MSGHRLYGDADADEAFALADTKVVDEAEVIVLDDLMPYQKVHHAFENVVRVAAALVWQSGHQMHPHRPLVLGGALRHQRKAGLVLPLAVTLR